ncbi:hypothetical protein X946_1944 [Burkholderia sp. ABCPW 111]|nr:hypothetical protein X946_1944 [Burkholderia sp. ABCPW 111]
MLSTQIVGASHDSPARTRQNPVRIRQFSARAAFGASSPSTHACAPACRQAAPTGTDAGQRRGGAGARGSVDRQHRRNSRRPAAQRRTSEKQQGFASPRLYQRRSTAINGEREPRRPPACAAASEPGTSNPGRQTLRRRSAVYAIRPAHGQAACDKAGIDCETRCAASATWAACSLNSVSRCTRAGSAVAGGAVAGGIPSNGTALPTGVAEASLKRSTTGASDA